MNREAAYGKKKKKNKCKPTIAFAALHDLSCFLVSFRFATPPLPSFFFCLALPCPAVHSPFFRLTVDLRFTVPFSQLIPFTLSFLISNSYIFIHQRSPSHQK